MGAAAPAWAPAQPRGALGRARLGGRRGPRSPVGAALWSWRTMALAWSWAMFGSAGLPCKDYNKVALAGSPGVGRAAWPLWLYVSGRAEGVVLWAASVQRAWASGGVIWREAAEPGSQPRLRLSPVSSSWGCAAPCLRLPWTRPCLACVVCPANAVGVLCRLGSGLVGVRLLVLCRLPDSSLGAGGLCVVRSGCVLQLAFQGLLRGAVPLRVVLPGSFRPVVRSPGFPSPRLSPPVVRVN